MMQQPRFTVREIQDEDIEEHDIHGSGPQIMVVLVNEGQVELQADGLHFTMDAGHFLAVPVNTGYSFWTAGNARGAAILASYGGFPANRLAWLAKLNGTPVQLGEKRAIMEKLADIVLLCTKQRLCSDGFLSGMLDLIFGLALETYSTCKPSGHFHGSLLVQDFLVLVSINIRREHAVGFYASALHVTPSHLNRTSKSATGLHAKACLECFLAYEARQLLADPAYNISEISDLLHFSHPAVFHRFFRRLTGTTPLHYRAQMGR